MKKQLGTHGFEDGTMIEFGLTKTERLLLYGLKQFKVTKEDATAIVAFMEEDDQILLIHYMMTHPNATPQDILNESGRLLKQRKRLTKEIRKNDLD